MFHGNNLIETTHLLNIPNWQYKASTSTFCLLPVRHIHLIPLVLQQTKNKPSSTDSRRANHITNGLFLSFSYILILSEKAMTLPINLAMLQELNGPYKLTRVKGQKPTYHNIKVYNGRKSAQKLQQGPENHTIPDGRQLGFMPSQP